MKTLFIVNPVAGRNKSLKIWNDIRVHIKYAFNYVLTTEPGNATKVAANAQNQGFTRVVAVGGDGTDIELGIIPAGTGNDFVKTLKIPQTPIEALTVLENGYADTVDIGKHEKGYFINVAGAGFDAEVVNTTNVSLKFLSGPLAYIISVVWNLIRYCPREAIVEIDGKIYHRKLWLAVAANGQYFGGGMRISPDALINDGLFDICLVNEMSRLEILKFLPKVFSGGHKNHRAFEVLRGKHVKIEFAAPTIAQIDGEVLGSTPIQFYIMPKALKVIRNNSTSA